MELPEILLRVVDQFGKIPGVGAKTALRQALLLSKWKEEELHAFGNIVKDLCRLKKCSNCGMFSDYEVCKICENEARGDVGIICVVESVTDCMAIENSHHFNGRYHILEGVLNPLMGVGPDELTIKKLLSRVSSEHVEEVILAINPSVEGDATCSYIRQVLPEKIKAERIGFGVPMGGSLEYLDPLTITKALEGRSQI